MAAKGNGTASAQFVLLGFSEQGHVQVVLFVVFPVIHVVTLLRNAELLVLIRLVAQPDQEEVVLLPEQPVFPRPLLFLLRRSQAAPGSPG